MEVVVFDRKWIEEHLEHCRCGNSQPILTLLPQLPMKGIRFLVYQPEWGFYRTIYAIAL